MGIETTISSGDAVEGIRLIEEYLHKGGSGRDAARLERLLDALGASDRICITLDGEPAQ